jgi:hypothetical protein
MAGEKKRRRRKEENGGGTGRKIMEEILQIYNKPGTGGLQK